MKTWKQLATGLLGLTLAASLTGGALAAGPKTAGAAGEAAKQETPAPKPAGPFSRWFPDMGVDPENPKASEAVLARMGAAIQQSKTVGDETLTLNAAVWDGGSVRLSLTAKSPNLPKLVDKYTWLNADRCTARMPEEQWKAYVENKIARESAGEELSKEERDQRFQYLMEQGQGQMELNPNLSVVSREGNTVQLAATMILDAYLEKPELTLHIENAAVAGQDAQTGTGAGGCLLKGPFEFTFTLDKVLRPVNYQGDMQAVFDKIPVRITSVSVSPTGVSAGYALDAKDSAAAEKLSARVEGVWTKDGKYVDCASSFAVAGVMVPEDGKPITGHWSRKYPYALDPAAVAAVKIGGVRVELGKLNSAAE